MSGLFAGFARSRKSKWSFWKFNWLAIRPQVLALERARTFASGTLLDVGCGTRPFAYLFEGHVERYLGTDLPSSIYLTGHPPDAYAWGEAQPLRDASVDTVLGLSMLTCLPEPRRLLDEAHRVLRPGGMLLMEFTQMVPLHDEPHDFYRFTTYGAKYLLEQAGFEVVECIPMGGLWTRVGMSMILPLNRLNRGPVRLLTELPVRLLYVVIQLACRALDRMFWNPREVLGNLVVARKRAGAGATA